MKHQKIEPSRRQKKAIRRNCAVIPELPAATQDLADLLVELAMRQLVRDKKLEMNRVKPNEK